MRRATAVFVFTFLQCCVPAAMALGFGPVTNGTRLGQPLDFTVAVKLDGDETLAPPCVAAEVTAGEARLSPSKVRTRLVRHGRAADALVRITSTSRVREPVVTVVLSLGCPARVAHKFVTLLDPAPPAPRAEVVVKPAAIVPAIAILQSPAPTPAAALAAPAPVPAEAPDARARDRDPLQALQERVDRLRDEQQAMQQSIGALQGKLRETEQMRHDPALYGLATLVVLLLGVIAALLWRQWRQRGDAAQPSHGQALGAAAAHATESRRRSSSTASTDDEVTQTSMRVVDSSYETPATMPPQVVPDASGLPATLPEGGRVRRELTAEELIDLEQQADFFIALGQEESAIDLLMGHVRSSGGTSPMPYLKLLAIYRRRGESEAYARIRERFRRRFNVRVPDWQSEASQSRPLEDYPDIVARLQRAWAMPARAADLLEALLFRRDPLQAGFDLPAYEELLFLYALTKDLADMENNPDGVDLLLPLDLADAAPAITHVASAAPQTDAPAAANAVDLELDLGSPSPAA